MNDLDLDKPLPSVIAIKCAESYLYSIGLSLFSFGSQTRNKFHNPFLISFIICVQMLKSITGILMKEDKYRLLLIGDLTYFLNGRYFFNSCTILRCIMALISQLLHCWKYYKNESPSYMKPFEMISGLVSPKSIGLMDKEDVIQLLKKSKLMFQFSKCLTFGMGFCCFCNSGLSLIINSTPSLYWIELLWSLFFAVCAHHLININLSQMTYFYILCLCLKLKLRNANNSITKSFEKKYKMTNYKMKNILKSLDSIISEINIHNNYFWSKYLMIVLMSVIIVFDIVLFESLFGKMSLFSKMLLFYASFVVFFLLIILINTASSVSFEANKSHKLLNKSFITTSNNKQIWIRMKIKACILIINLVFILMHFLIIFVLSIFWQLLSFIERIAKKKIGFYYWKIFIFDYFRVYEVSFEKKSLDNLKHNRFTLKFVLLRYWY
jgi:hypothetical protein